MMASSVQAYGKVNDLERSTKHYLGPEVRTERRYSVARDIYSLGRMLKAISCSVGFYQRVGTLVKEATKETSERPSLEVFTSSISELPMLLRQYCNVRYILFQVERFKRGSVIVMSNKC